MTPAEQAAFAAEQLSRYYRPRGASGPPPEDGPAVVPDFPPEEYTPPPAAQPSGSGECPPPAAEAPRKPPRYERPKFRAP